MLVDPVRERPGILPDVKILEALDRGHGGSELKVRRLEVRRLRRRQLRLCSSTFNLPTFQRATL